MTQNKYANLNEDQFLKYIEEKKTMKVLQDSKKKFDKKNKKQKEMNDNQVLVAKLNSELSNKRDNDRQVDAALIDSEKMYIAERNMAPSKQMEEDRKLGLFGDYPEINSALNRNYNSLLKIENLRKNEVIPDDFIRISGGDK
jgi:hypothetical protein